MANGGPAAALPAMMEQMSRTRFLLLPALLLWPLAAQMPEVPPLEEEKDAKLPNGRLQKDEIAKAAYQSSLDDSKKLIAAAEELKAELEKNDRYVVSLAAIRKTEEIEKLARRIRGRLKQ
jgi:hypothetical protein